MYLHSFWYFMVQTHCSLTKHTHQQQNRFQKKKKRYPTYIDFCVGKSLHCIPPPHTHTHTTVHFRLPTTTTTNTTTTTTNTCITTDFLAIPPSILLNGIAHSCPYHKSVMPNLSECNECMWALNMARHSPVWNLHTRTTLWVPVWPDARRVELPFRLIQDTWK